MKQHGIFFGIFGGGLSGGNRQVEEIAAIPGGRGHAVRD
jgi:hypothetical protein